MWVLPGSSVQGPTGLRAGDVIKTVNDCSVDDMTDWRNCLSRSIINPTLSICMDKDLMKGLDKSLVIVEEDWEKARRTGILECCDEESASSNLCFRDLDGESSSWKGHACLPVREALEKSGGTVCNKTLPCSEKKFCMQASLANTTRLVIRYPYHCVSFSARLSHHESIGTIVWALWA